MDPSKKYDWHTMNVTEVTDLLRVSTDQGLDKNEVEKRQKLYGRNQLTATKQQSALLRFLLQFHQPLIYILLVATVVTVTLEEFVDASVIFGVIFINAIIGYIQETKALKAIDALSRSMTSRALVVRNGVKEQIDAAELVPGDVVLVSPGDKFPADLRLIHIRDLKADESALTGESVAVEKHTDPVPADSIIGDMHCMGFSSTNITYGQGKGIVVATGDKTEVGKIQESIASAEDLETPLTRKIKSFSTLLLWVILALAGILMIVGLLRGEPLEETFMAAVALAVGAIPEGLPVAVTIMLAIGVSKMAKRKAIIRKLVAVETLGSTNVICSDKTGTLTENQMTVQKIFAGGETFDVSGLGYRPEGEIFYREKPLVIHDWPALGCCLKAGILCNDSELKEIEGHWLVEGDPTEGALIVSASKAGYDLKDLTKIQPRIDSIPFESEHQYMATLHGATLHGGDEPIIYAKGSAEAILDRCSSILKADGNEIPLDKASILEQVESLASEGLRVLAFASKKVDQSLKTINHKDTSSEMLFLGLQGMIDPPREEAVEAVRLCQKAGIEVKMITGDHAVTAASIAEKIGLRGKLKDGALVAITGKELQMLPEDQLRTAAEDIAVFARVSPDQKLLLVKALQAGHHIVAMTGDGVNDGPALKQANIGIAMGISGTEVAKDASDMVLTDDNFSSIEGAVEEGRGVFDNLTKFIAWTLPTNLGEGLVILAAVVLSTQLPMQPVHLLWVNMTTAIFLGLMLAFEPKEPGIMERPPRPYDLPILTNELIMRTLLVGILMMVSAFGLFLYEVNVLGKSIAEGQTVATTVFVIMESFYLINCRSLVRPLKEIGFFTNKWVYVGLIAMIIFQLLFIYTPVMNTLFGSRPIGVWTWLRILGAGAFLFTVISIEKAVRFKSMLKKEATLGRV